MFTKLGFLPVVALAFMVQAAPVVPYDLLDAQNFHDQGERSILPRGINIPWKFVGPSILGTVTLDNLYFHNAQDAFAWPGFGTTPAQTVPGTSTPSPVPASSPPPAATVPMRRSAYASYLGKYPGWEKDQVPRSQPPPQERGPTAVETPTIPPLDRKDQVRSSSVDPSDFDTTRPGGRGINIPWRWVGPSIAGTVVLDHLFMDNPPTPIGGPETTMTYPVFSNPQAAASPTAAGPSTSPTRVVNGKRADTSASPRSYEQLGENVEPTVRKVPIKWIGLGILGGVVLDRVLPHLPRPYFHRQPHLRALDYGERADAAGSKRSEHGDRINLPWK
ncbi:hypothetical protein CF326_g4363 [Tilletia indica]|uniref:Uncharacterized protein n=1 Tax=Tilletia indica TaxID=43049 RepID=A0A177T4T9_9BASI|nr:hypothetical protein CF326_g4363 [Tilletia indica]KAE8241234.1 hypothetical protein A4X13_0g7504 [Tilletia indica]